MEKHQDRPFCCGICGGADAGGKYSAREMMFGLGTTFHYAQCGECGSLWLTDPPENLADYYPRDYYSFAKGRAGIIDTVKVYLRNARDRAYFGSAGALGRFLASQCQEGALRAIAKLQIRRDAKILDVGCGNGRLLRRLMPFGFRNLVGIDPYIEPAQEFANGNGLIIRRCGLDSIVGEKYDLVMFHHSLEHVSNPVTALNLAAGLLSRGGKCLVRLPVVAYAWEKYGTNWVQLDPPRHMWIPTQKAMLLLGDSVGLRLEHVEYDSTEYQFWGSEMCIQEVPIGRARLHQKIYPWPRGAWRFRSKVEQLNRQGRGDQASFLYKAA